MNDDQLTVDMLDIEDPDISQEEQQEEPVNEPEIQQEEPEKEDVITMILKDKGIEDPTKIKFTDDNGNLQDKNWNDLTAEEQYNILNTPQDTSDTDLDDEEIEFINQLRLSGLSPEEYINSLTNTPSVEMPTYKVDDIPDDELFVLDLQARSENMTEDELVSALQTAKANEELYNKQIAGIREEYRQLEDQDRSQKEALQQAEQEEILQQVQQDVLGKIDSLNSIGNLDIELSNDDKNELAEFMLGKDQAGVSYLGKAINDTETLTKMAWFALYGEQALDDIQEYFSDQITKARQAGYEEGLKASKPSVVVRQSGMNNASDVTDINQLDF